MKTLRPLKFKQLLAGSALLLVFVSFANKIVHQPGFIKKVVCEETSIADEEEAPEYLPLIIVGFDYPVAVYHSFSENTGRAEAPAVEEHKSGAWPAMWICYMQMKIELAG